GLLVGHPAKYPRGGGHATWMPASMPAWRWLRCPHDRSARSSSHAFEKKGGNQMVDWEKNWRGNGVIAAVLFVISYVIYGSQPRVGASAEKLLSFYDGDGARALISTVGFAFATLCLMWFAAALASVLRDAGKGGWGTAATAGRATLGAVYFVRITIRAALAYSIAGSGNDQVTSAFNDVSWAVIVLGWF